MKYIKYFLLTAIFLFLNYLQCVEISAIKLPFSKDLLPEICNYLDLASISNLLITCQTYSIPYYRDILESLHLRKELSNVPRGMDLFLQDNKNICKNLSSTDYTHVLIRYAKENDAFSFKRIIQYENSANHRNRINNLILFKHITQAHYALINEIDHEIILQYNIKTYKAIAKDLATVSSFLIIDAVKYNNCNALRILLENNINIHIKGSGGNTPLHIAAYKGYKNIALLLINSAKIKKFIDIKNDHNDTALQVATFHQHTKIIRLFLEKNACIDNKNKDGNTALHLACLNGNKKNLELLIVKNIDINMQNKHGNTCLHLVVSKNHKDILHLLLEKGAHINIKNNNKLSPRKLALKNGNKDIAKILKHAKKNPVKKQFSLLKNKLMG